MQYLTRTNILAPFFIGKAPYFCPEVMIAIIKEIAVGKRLFSKQLAQGRKLHKHMYSFASQPFGLG